MATKPFEPEELLDFLGSFDAGVNFDIDPLKLKPTQMAAATNVTVRGTFATHRPAFRKMLFDFSANPGAQLEFEAALWQGATFYKPDSGPESMVVAISGMLFNVIPKAAQANGASVVDLTQGNAALMQSTTAPQEWLWQAEKWVIWNDGINNPIFYDGSTLRRAVSYQTLTFTLTLPLVPTTTNFTATTTGTNYAHALNSNLDRPDGHGGVVAGWEVSSLANIVAGDIITVGTAGTIKVTSTANGLLFGINLTIPPESTFSNGTVLSWSHTALAAPNPATVSTTIQIPFELPPGKMGAYDLGRNWVVLPDGKQFAGSDLVGDSSGTIDNQFRDAVLKVTQNNFLAGGGNFRVPSSGSEIRALAFAATLDTSLGQGPLQVFTVDNVFSCNAPVDRTVWHNLTNPILTESLITNGGLSQDATTLANGDILFRSIDGARSLVLARQEFGLWGNVPQSREVAPILRKDNQALLQYAGAEVFDNRYLLTNGPIQTAQGVIHTGLVVMNFDPLSSLRGKEPSIWEGAWSGMNGKPLNILKMIVGTFNAVERCFMFRLNTDTSKIELWELLPSDGANPTFFDNDGTEDIRIPFNFEGHQMLFGEPEGSKRRLKQLTDGEIYVDNLSGTVDFEVWYQPDQYPGWILWHKWTETADTTVPASQLQFRPRLPLGEPTILNADPVTDRPFRNFYSCQTKFVFRGHCRFIGGMFKCVTIPEPAAGRPATGLPIPPALLLPAVQP